MKMAELKDIPILLASFVKACIDEDTVVPFSDFLCGLADENLKIVHIDIVKDCHWLIFTPALIWTFNKPHFWIFFCFCFRFLSLLCENLSAYLCYITEVRESSPRELFQFLTRTYHTIQTHMRPMLFASSIRFECWLFSQTNPLRSISDFILTKFFWLLSITT